MKKLLFSSIISIFVIGNVQAQLPDLSKAKESATTTAGPGKLLTQLAGAIKPASFLSSWAGNKSGWLSKAGKVTDAVGTAQSVASLAGAIKPDMFKSGFNVGSLIQTANTVKTMSAATGVLKNLEGGLKPEALSDSWNSQRSGWLSALSLVK